MLFLYFFTRSLVDLQQNFEFVVDKLNQKWSALSPKMLDSDTYGISTLGFPSIANKKLENWAPSFDTETHGDITMKVLGKLNTDYKFEKDDGTKSFDLQGTDDYLKALSIISTQLFQINQRYVGCLSIFWNLFQTC